MGHRRHERRLRLALVVDAGAERVEVGDDVFDREHSQPEALVLEARGHLEVGGDELEHASILSGMDTNTRSY